MSAAASGRPLDQDLFEEILDGAEEAGDVRLLVDALAQAPAVGQAVGVPAGELPQLVEGVLRALALGHHAEVTEDEVAPVLERGLQVRAAPDAGGDLAKDPGV